MSIYEVGLISEGQKNIENPLCIFSCLFIFARTNSADVVELVDTLDLGSSAARRGGSTPFIRTN